MTGVDHDRFRSHAAPRSTTPTRRSAPRWCRSPAGRCRCSTPPASSPSTTRCAPAPGCSTSPTWASSRSPAPTGTPSSTGSPATTSSALEPGGVQYSAILTPEGTFVDDCTVYRFDDKLMIVVNASNVARAWEHIVEQKGGANVRLKDISDEVGLLALQGPERRRRCSSRSPTPGSTTSRYYHFAAGKIAGAQCFISRTGYTGEDGFELYCRERDTVAHLGGDHRRRRQADRPRRPRLAPAGDGLRALRQRHRRHHHAARGRARLDREARQGRAVHGRQGAPRAEAARRHPEAGRLPARGPRLPPPRLSGATTRAATWTSSGAAP